MGVCCCISLWRRKIHSMVATPATVKVTILLFFFHPCISNQIARYSCLTPLPLFCESIRFYLSAVPIVSEISISYIDSIFVPISCNENKILNESKKIDQFNLVFVFYEQCLFVICSSFSCRYGSHPHHLLGRRELLLCPVKRVISYQ